MNKHLNNYITLTIPDAFASDRELFDCLLAVHKVAGGATITECKGVWIDDSGNPVWDDNFKVQWNFANIGQRMDLEPLVQKVVDHLHDLGEVCVMVEWYYTPIVAQFPHNHDGYHCELLYPVNK